VKAQDSKVLVQLEARLEKLKVEDRKRLMDSYTGMVDWLMMLINNPRHKLLEDNFKPVTSAYGAINEVSKIIKDTESNLASSRRDIDANLD
jgi:hypothetical protein